MFSLVSEWDWAEDMCEVGKREGGTLNVVGSSVYKDRSCPIVELAYSPYDDSDFQDHDNSAQRNQMWDRGVCRRKL